ncbi:MAG: ferredoxin [Bacteroidetes bacterium B1(2017)]|nr:MAG: ferredoxin [Bacteroidetes bacterium B1(2017)]
MANIKVSVNLNKCVGSQLCMMFSPSVFDKDENRQARVYNPEGADLTELLGTAEQCPQCAIKVENTDTGEVLFPPPELAF